MKIFINTVILIFYCQLSTVLSDDGEIKFHEPTGAQTQQSRELPKPRRQPPGRHTNFHINLNKERDHIKEHIKEDYLDIDKLDDTKLLMQYFRKHDTDGNFRLDGLEILKAISRMSDEDDHHHDDEDHEPAPEPLPVEDVLDIVDHILQEDDKNGDGYITWPEFVNRQKKDQKENN